MSFKMLIVDDEPIICRGLRYTIPWDKYNIEVADVSHDGKDAIWKIQTNPSIDIVITDVKMPKADGLELATFLHDQYPDIQIIMISGFDEFSYAQQAIKLGVKDYLLKPVDVDELVNKVLNLTKEIEQKRKETVKRQQMGLTNAIFHQISDDTVRNPDKQREYDSVKIYPFISLLRDYMKKIKGLSPEKINELKLNWKNFIQTTLNKNGFESISIFTSDNVLLTSIIGEKETFTIKKEVFDDEGLLFVWSDSLINLVDLKERFTILTREIKFLPFKKNCDGALDRKSGQNYPHEIEKKIIDGIFQSENEKLRNTSLALFTYFSANEFFLEEIVQVCGEILTKVINRYESFRGKEADSLELNYRKFIDVHLYNSYALLQDLFVDDVDSIVNNLDLKNDKRDWMIERAEDYIHDYYKSNIKVSEVANVINISPNYLSSLFKQKTGKNFNEYVNHLRIEEAKILLVETPFKVNEISEQVGFHEYKYFVEVFKKFSDMTPTIYRKLMSMK